MVQILHRIRIPVLPIQTLQVFKFHQKKNYLEADKCYEEALSLNPQHLQTLFNKVSLEYQKRNTESCVLYLNQILEIQPDNQKAKLLLDQVL